MEGAARTRPWFPWLCACGDDDTGADGSPAAATIIRSSPQGAGGDFGTGELPPTVHCLRAGRRDDGGDTSGLLPPRPAQPRGRDVRVAARVLVHVYDLGDSFFTRGLWNSVARGYGMFHTGVEVYGQEFSFGGAAPSDGDGEGDAARCYRSAVFDAPGISWGVPKANPDHSFRETLSMGLTALTEHEVMQLVAHMQRRWASSTYNVLSHNCHDFSHELCLSLGVAGLPDWVNSLAPTGARANEYLDATDSGYDGGEAVFGLLGAVRGGLLRGLGLEAG